MRNLLKEAVVNHDGHAERFKRIRRLIEAEYSKPVQVAIVIGLENGGPTDFGISGNMSTEDIALAAMSSRALYLLNEAAKAEEAPAMPQPTSGPLSQIDPENWKKIPANMKSALLDAAKEGNVDVIVQDEDDEDAQHVAFPMGLDNEY